MDNLLVVTIDILHINQIKISVSCTYNLAQALDKKRLMNTTWKSASTPQAQRTDTSAVSGRSAGVPYWATSSPCGTHPKGVPKYSKNLMNKKRNRAGQNINSSDITTASANTRMYLINTSI